MKTLKGTRSVIPFILVPADRLRLFNVSATDVPRGSSHRRNCIRAKDALVLPLRKVNFGGSGAIIIAIMIMISLWL